MAYFQHNRLKRLSKYNRGQIDQSGSKEMIYCYDTRYSIIYAQYIKNQRLIEQGGKIGTPIDQ